MAPAEVTGTNEGALDRGPGGQPVRWDTYQLRTRPCGSKTEPAGGDGRARSLKQS